MRNKILTLLLGSSMLCALPLQRAMAAGEDEDLSRYDVTLDVTPAHVGSHLSTTNYLAVAFDNQANECTDTAGLISGSSFLAVNGTSSSVTPKLQISLKEPSDPCRILAGTYDVYLVMVPHYYLAPEEAPEVKLKNKIAATLYYHDGSKGQSTVKSPTVNLEYDGNRVDTVMLYEGWTFPLSYYGSSVYFPALEIGSQRLSNTQIRNGYTYAFNIDRIILKARSIDRPTPGIETGSCGENCTYSFDRTSGRLSISGTGTLTALPPLDFIGLSLIKEVVIEDGITEIGAELFRGSTVSAITLPRTLQAIGDHAFANCTSLVSLAIPASVKTIGTHAFDGSGLMSIALPSGLQTIEAGTFANCDTLTSVSIPASVKTIGEQAFYGCALKAISLPEGVQTIGSQAFALCDSLASISLPATLTAIGDSAFSQTNLREITIPVNLRTMGQDLFTEVPLTTVYWNARACSFDTVKPHPFLSVRDSITTFHIGQQVQHIPDGLCWSLGHIEDFSMGENVEDIGRYAFEFSSIMSINIPAKTTRIDESAFYHSSLNAIHVAEGNAGYCDVDGILFSKDKTRLVYFPSHATGSKRYDIPAQVTSLGEFAFADYAPSTLSLPWADEAAIPAGTDETFAPGITFHVPNEAVDIYQSLAPYSGHKIIANINLPEYMAASDEFSIFNRLLVATGWADSLRAERDEEYERLLLSGHFPTPPAHPTYRPIGSGSFSYPRERKYGFTILAETDSVYEAMTGLKAGDITPEAVARAVESLGIKGGENNGKYTSPDNTLNLFVSYHLLPVALDHKDLVIHFNEYGYSRIDRIPASNVTEYHETMGRGRRLLKMSESAKSGGLHINRYVRMDPKTYMDDPDATEGFIPGILLKRDAKRAINGYVYAIHEPLLYTDETARKVLGSERMRHDLAALLPELMNNGIRNTETYDGAGDCVFPRHQDYPYFANVEVMSDTYTYYLGGRINKSTAWTNYQGDEFGFIGSADIIIKLPAVPVDGVYELRLGINRIDRCGVRQFFFGQDKDHLSPCGLPVDMTKRLSYFLSDFEDTNDEILNRLIDLQLHEKNMMKGPKSIISSYSDGTARHEEARLRTIIGRFAMKAGETYYLRITDCNVVSSLPEIDLDYIELVPQSVYANPIEAEDIW